jgi:ABC-type transport system involved in cytochrome bd biosynthesis fused ATPase/permease subunit
MIDRLDRLIGDVAALHSKLIVIVGASGAGKSALIANLGTRHDAHVLNVGSELSRRLAARPAKQRALGVPTILRDLADEHAAKDILLLDNIELLFDRTLRLDPLDLLKQLARSRRVVAVWPGELRDGRLIYAEMGHPEHQDYGLEGLVPFAVQ